MIQSYAENYYISPLDKYIECDFSTFLASTASKWHIKEVLNIFWLDIIRGKKQNFDLNYNDITLLICPCMSFGIICDRESTASYYHSSLVLI
jgi:hypothetical protein